MPEPPWDSPGSSFQVKKESKSEQFLQKSGILLYIHNPLKMLTMF